MADQPKRSIDYAAWALVLITLLGVAFTFYGQFEVLKNRMDEADNDRHEMMDQLEHLSQQMNHIEQYMLELRK